MKSCLHCKHAEWKKTASGRLHPSGDGRCKYPLKPQQIPACMYWIGRTAPMPNGGHISRHEELSEHCVFFARGES